MYQQNKQPILIPIRTKDFFAKKTLNIAIPIAKSKKFEFFLYKSNHTILHLTSMRMGGTIFKNLDCTNCKILAFKVKRQVFFSSYGT